MGTTKYIISQGQLKRKDNSLCFRRDGKNIYLPIKNIKELFLLNEVSLNSKLLDFLSRNKVVVHFFNYYGNYSGTFYPKDKYISGKLLIKQVKTFENNRINIAKSIVKGISKNIHETLYHYYKHGKKDIKQYLDWIKNDFEDSLSVCEKIEEVYSLEALLWQKFYNTFSIFLNEDFILSKRVRRPPDNPINALISFGNSLLYSKTISAIYRTHLNQSVSFLHSPSESRFSLSLDICEVFKPILVFKTIFDLVNNRRIRIEDHFISEYNYCILNEEGKNIFIEAFEDRLESKYKNTKLNRFVSYRTSIKLDCYKLIKYIMEDEEFIPFSLKDKR